MRVFLEPTGTYSRAMTRVSRALERYAPPEIEIVSRKQDAQLVLLHVISADQRYRGVLPHQHYAVAQYCLSSSGQPDPTQWQRFWNDSACVWSYYDLSQYVDDSRWLYAPLGVDAAFYPRNIPRERLVVTTGYVHGDGAEAITEVWQAANACGVEAIHVGPDKVFGMDAKPLNWNAVHNISDDELATIYSRATWVAALRHIEGFELPAVEGGACGAIPIIFMQPATVAWHGDYAIGIPETSGEELVELLIALFNDPRALLPTDIDFLPRFDWQTIATKFWDTTLTNLGV